MSEDKHLEKVDHSYLRYANVWEDAEVLIEALKIENQNKVLSIASAGDNALALLSQNPQQVVAIDLNRGQLYLSELKKVSIANLEHEEFLEFVGFKEAGARWKTYLSLRSALTPQAQTFWDAKEQSIRDGLIYAGKFEKYLQTFAKRVLPLIHKKTTVEKLFSTKTADEQLEFYQRKWDTWSWRILFRLFFSKRIMGFFGRDKAFLKQVKVHVGKTILAKAGEHLSSVYAQNNPFLHFCLTGNYGPHLPFYARKENYEKIKANLDRLEIEYGYAQDASIKYGKFDRFNLSNIFEYMNPQVFQITSQSLLECALPDARFAYWNLMVERRMSNVVHGLDNIDMEENWAERDIGFFYMDFVLDHFTR